MQLSYIPIFIFKNGDIAHAFSAIYGFSSLLPIILADYLGIKISAQEMTVNSFRFFGIGLSISILILAITRNDYFPALLAVSLLFLYWSYVTNTKAIAISPGFNPFRLLPTFLCLCLLAFAPKSRVILITAFSLLLINGNAFNILLLAGLVASCLICFILALLNREPLDNDLLNLKLITVCCLAVASQFVIAFGAESMEINSAFSSFMEMGSRSIKGTILSAVTINFLPALLFLCVIFFGTKSERNNAFVIFAVTLTLSLYALRFWNSPQHFAGHIIISAPCVAYLSKVLFDRVPITKFILFC